MKQEKRQRYDVLKAWVRRYFTRVYQMLRLCVGTCMRRRAYRTDPLLAPQHLPKATATLRDARQKEYFIEAKSWADDVYTRAIVSRNRYKLAFLVCMGLAFLLVIAINGLIPLQHMQPLLVNHYEDGRVSVTPMKTPYTPDTQAQVESELVRYVINRESYDASSYRTQYSLIHLLSDSEVARQYRVTQSAKNTRAPINVLGKHGWRTVYVDNVVFLDTAAKNKGLPAAKQTHHNLAQINFTLTDHLKQSSVKKAVALTALVSWRYRGIPNNPSDRWRDWNGFTITRYTTEQRNI